MNSSITLKKIAIELDLSVSTISRALRNHSRVSLKTRNAVKKLAQELNYKPNLKAMFLRNGRSHLIGVIIPSALENFYAKSLTSIENEAGKCGYSILFGQSYDEEEREKKIITTMIKQRVDGLLISSSEKSTHINNIASLKRYNIPVVYFGKTPPIQNINKVFCRVDKGTEKIVESFLKTGRKRIALINGPDKLTSAQQRLKGYSEVLSRNTKGNYISIIERTDLSEKGTQLAMHNLLNSKIHPDAVICFNDYVHLDAVAFAAKNGITVNEGILFAGFGNIDINKYIPFAPAITFDQMPYQQGTDAIKTLIQIMDSSHQNLSKEKYFIHREVTGNLIYNDRCSIIKADYYNNNLEVT